MDVFCHVCPNVSHKGIHVKKCCFRKAYLQWAKEKKKKNCKILITAKTAIMADICTQIIVFVLLIFSFVSTE